MLGRIELRSGFQHAERLLDRVRTRRALRALIEAACQPMLEPLAAERPILLVTIQLKAGVTDVIAITEKLGRRCQLDQNVGLFLFLCRWRSRIGVFYFILWRRRCRWLPQRSAFAFSDQPRAAGIALKPITDVALMFEAGSRTMRTLAAMGSRARAMRCTRLRPASSLSS